MPPSRQNLVCLWLSVGLYAIAHVLPAITGDPWLFGWQASIACVEGATWSVLKGEPAWLFLFGWLPNPLFWLAVLWLLVRRRGNPRRLGTKAGRSLLAWAHVRAVEWYEPTAVLASWEWQFCAEPGAADVTMNVKPRLHNDGTV